MALPCTCSKELWEQLPAAARNMYVALDDGRMVLDIEDADSHPSVAPLRRAYDRQVAEGERLRSEVEEWDRRWPTFARGWTREHLAFLRSYRDPIAELAELRARNEREIGEVQREIDAIRADREKMESQMASWDQQNALKRELEAVGVRSELMSGALALFLPLAQLAGEVVTMRSEKYGSETVRSFVRRWASSDEGLRWLDPRRPPPPIIDDDGRERPRGKFTELVRKLK